MNGFQRRRERNSALIAKRTLKCNLRNEFLENQSLFDDAQVSMRFFLRNTPWSAKFYSSWYFINWKLANFTKSIKWCHRYCKTNSCVSAKLKSEPTSIMRSETIFLFSFLGHSHNHQFSRNQTHCNYCISGILNQIQSKWNASKDFHSALTHSIVTAFWQCQCQWREMKNRNCTVSENCRLNEMLTGPIQSKRSVQVCRRKK